MVEKEGEISEGFVKWFSELNKDSGAVAGGKGANLAEIFNLKVPVPPGFVVTAQAYDYFIKKARLDEKIKNILSKINYEDTKQLDESTKQIRELIINSEFPEEMKQEIIEAYETLSFTDYDIKESEALEILEANSEPVFVAVRSSATTEDLAEASFAGQQDTYLNIKGNEELIDKVKKCFASLFTSRATYYRIKKGFKHEQASLAVVVQKMINSDKSGVMFSKDPNYKSDNVVMEAVFGLGEGIVSGRITPDKYEISKKLEILDKKISDKRIAMTRSSSGENITIKLKEEKSKEQVLTTHEIKMLAEYGLKLEEHYKKPQDIEFAIEDDKIFIVQTRPITTLEKRVEKTGHTELKGEIILTGLAASPGIAVGEVKIVREINDLQKIKEGDILVTEMTNPDMVVTMQKSAGIITDEGGLTAHAAIVSREMGIPCIVGTRGATAKLKEGDIITMDAYSGKIYKGKISETKQKEILPVTAQTRTKIKVIVDLPTFAQRAAKAGIKKVGLTRLEGIIAESGKHPNYFLQKNKIKDYEEIIFKGINEIGKYFEEIWVRTSDIRSDEFKNLDGAPKEIEANPMLGMHGIRFSVKNPEILKAELKALQRVSQQKIKIGILLPQVISVGEVKQVKQVLKEINFSDAKLGVMIETPASVQIINELCEEKINFISFGTNDLTQYILAIDRGNEQVQHLYDEMHPAVLRQLEYVIRVCKKHKVETSICGQAGSKKEMVKFLVEKGIDSISVNADAAKEISDYVKQMEDETLGKKGELPRKYQPEEKIPKINGLEKLQPRQGEELERDIDAIEEEKEEYLKGHPEEG
ncbi:MAG: phosphoenolpyruvate synthase [Nanoarchaeota archaeon]|nr:phosphoenolpyruvate synthase [Nanoarchaeota archaeon]